MIHPTDRDRRVIPRWRHVDDSLDPRAKSEHTPIVRSDVRKREEEWARRATRGTALELIAVAATTPSPSPAAHEAAEWLLGQGEMSDTARRMALQVVNSTAPAPSTTASSDFTQAQVRAEIRRLRASAHDDNRNALAWTELSRMYILLGQGTPALDAMHRAIAAAPHHRHILRAAARMHVHLGDPSAAHRLLAGNARTKLDPWLLASEISVASISDRSSRLLRSARGLLEARHWSKRDLTELASAMATMELEAGKDKRARDLFRASLQDPNDNSLAQAEWAAHRVPAIRGQLEPALEQTPRSWEAQAVAAAGQGRHISAAEHAWLWLLDQPFSSEAATFGSYEAAISMNFQMSLEFARRGLMASPRHQTLLNNAAFAAAKMDRPREAQEFLNRWTPNDSPHDRAFFLATQGLIAFRSRQIEEGQRLYEQAMSASPDSKTRTRARLMLASELLHLHSPGLEELVSAIRAEARATLSPSEQSWLDYLADD